MLHHDVYALAGLHCLHELDNVRVLQSSQQGDLIFEVILALLIEELVLVVCLDHHLPPRSRVKRCKYFSEGSLANLLSQLILLKQSRFFLEGRYTDLVKATVFPVVYSILRYDSVETDSGKQYRATVKTFLATVIWRVLPEQAPSVPAVAG